LWRDCGANNALIRSCKNAAGVHLPALAIRKACIAAGRSCQSGSSECQFAQNEKKVLCQSCKIESAFIFTFT
jgi:hypothetical protein